MPTDIQQTLKDLLYNMQAFLYWRDVYINSGEWQANKNMNSYIKRVSELLPPMMDYIKHNDL